MSRIYTAKKFGMSGALTPSSTWHYQTMFRFWNNYH